ncbi:MAG: SurA N-terminal domain-containing protein [Desulfosalsimonadaceae bacterium]
MLGVYWLSGIVLLFGTGFGHPAFSAEVVDRIVAVVNDDIIRLTELNKAVAPLEEQVRLKDYAPEKEQEEIYRIRQEMLNSLIDDKLADQEIKTAGIFVDEQEIDQAIEQVKKANYYSDEDLRGALTASGISMSDYRNEIKKQMHRNQLVNQKIKSKVIITESDVTAYYNDHPEIYASQKKYMIRNILMPVEPGIDKSAKQGIRAKMESVHQQLSEGAAFDKMAREHSEAVNADDGGKLGLFALDELAENIKAVVAPLKPGAFSPIVETDQGFQIFYVEEIQDSGGKELSEVADEIRQTLYEDAVNKKFQSWIETLRKDAHIKIIQ